MIARIAHAHAFIASIDTCSMAIACLVAAIIIRHAPKGIRRLVVVVCIANTGGGVVGFDHACAMIAACYVFTGILHWSILNTGCEVPFFQVIAIVAKTNGSIAIFNRACALVIAFHAITGSYDRIILNTFDKCIGL